MDCPRVDANRQGNVMVISVQPDSRPALGIFKSCLSSFKACRVLMVSNQQLWWGGISIFQGWYALYVFLGVMYFVCVCVVDLWPLIHTHTLSGVFSSGCSLIIQIYFPIIPTIYSIFTVSLSLSSCFPELSIASFNREKNGL